jgi:hypothetical protein
MTFLDLVTPTQLPPTINWGSSPGGGMLASVYDPAGIDQQVVGTTAIQTLTNKTLINPTIAEINGYTLTPGMTTLVDGVAEFGIDNTGTVADNSTAINNALEAGAKGGYGILIPMQPGNVAAVVKIANPIVLGNGVTTTPSTYQGGLLVGGGWPGSPGAAAGQFSDGACEILWTGGSLGTAVEVSGALQGWGLKNLTIINPAGYGLLLNSAQFGLAEDLSIYANYCVMHNTIAAGSEFNCMHNTLRRISLELVNGGVGIWFGNTATNTSNACYESYEDVFAFFSATPSAATYVLLFGSCDNCRVTRVHMAGGGSTHAVAASFNFGSTWGAGTWPVDCQVDMADLGGYPVTILSGTPNAGVYNTFSRLSNTNGVTLNPQLNGIIWDAPGQPTGVLSASPVTFTSTAAWTNKSGVPVTVYLTGGTITAVSIGGSSLGTGTAALAGPWRVAAAQTITFTGTGTITGDVIGD